MNSRDRIAQIIRWRTGQDPSRRYVHYELERLQKEVETKSATVSDVEAGAYPVRAIALLEVFTRAWVKVMVDESRTIAERGTRLIENIKPDYHLILGVSDRVITFGDIVAYAVSVSNIGHVIGHFQALCDRDMRPLLETAVDRWEVEIRGGSAKPIVDDYDGMCAEVSKLFELRHAICHEAPLLLRTFPSVDLGSLLKSVTKFVQALEEVLTTHLFGKVPLTQTDMNAEAGLRFRVADDAMQVVLKDLREKYKDRPRNIRLLNVAQSAWERYRKMQSVFRHDPVQGGTIGPMLRSSEAEALTIERTKHLKSFLDAGEGML